MYTDESAGRDTLVASNSGKIDIDVKKQWRQFGEDITQL